MASPETIKLPPRDFYRIGAELRTLGYRVVERDFTPLEKRGNLLGYIKRMSIGARRLEAFKTS
jgi:hypothetical protein